MSAKVRSTTVQDLLFFGSIWINHLHGSQDLTFLHSHTDLCSTKVTRSADSLPFLHSHTDLWSTWFATVPPVPGRSIPADQLEASGSSLWKKVLFFMISGNQRKTLENLLSCLPVQSNKVVDTQHWHYNRDTYILITTFFSHNDRKSTFRLELQFSAHFSGIY